MTFTGTWYKNGPLRMKNRHPFVGTGNVIQFKFKKGQLYEMEQKKIVLPLHQKYLPQIDQNGIAYRNEGNISVQYYNNKLYAMAEMMAPYVLDPDSLDTRCIKAAIPSGVHPKIHDNHIWNCYVYGKHMIITKNFKHFKTIEFTKTYYVHDFFINDECIICALNEYDFDWKKPPLDGMDFTGNTQLFVYYFSKDIHVQYPFPDSVSNHIITHIANVEESETSKKIRCFGIAKGCFNFMDIKKPNEYMSIPIELTLSENKLKLSQYWSYINGDMPVAYENKIAFVNSNSIFLWEPETWNIKCHQFRRSVLEEPVWTTDGHVLLIEHSDITNVHTFDSKLNLVSSQVIPRVNISFHGVWVDST